MRMRCILEPPGVITVRDGEFGQMIVNGDVVDFSAPMPGCRATWAEALAGHESAFTPEVPVKPSTTKKREGQE